MTRNTEVAAAFLKMVKGYSQADKLIAYNTFLIQLLGHVDPSSYDQILVAFGEAMHYHFSIEDRPQQHTAYVVKQEVVH